MTMTYESVTVVDSRVAPGVTFTVTKMSYGRRTELMRRIRDEGVRKTLSDQAQEPVGGTAEAYARFVREESEKYGRLVKELNITIE